jgi:two-component sensor histidine kinase
MAQSRIDRSRVEGDTHGFGPLAAEPDRKGSHKLGFGTRLIERSLAQDLDGDVRIEFAPTGVTCMVDAPTA